MKILISDSWKNILKEEIEKDYFKKIISFLEAEKKCGKIIFPEEKNIFKALELTPFDNIKVVILGQDPYHGEAEAHGLSFSAPDGVKIPPSLRNIFKEISNSLPSTSGEGLGVRSGNLEYLANQGVLLLNTVLTVEKNKANSHKNIGWEKFTDNIISQISEKKEDIVFLLWGNQAKSKAKLIGNNKHLILQTSHPSPLGSYRGFLGSGCFRECNDYLKSKLKKEISW